MPTRIQRRRTRGWRKPDNCVIVSRPSRFGNPFTLTAAQEMGYIDPRAAAVEAFEVWLRGDPLMWMADESDPTRERILASLPMLRGKDLACTCPPGENCHADVLLAWLALPETELAERVARIRTRVNRRRERDGDQPLTP